MPSVPCGLSGVHGPLTCMSRALNVPAAGALCTPRYTVLTLGTAVMLEFIGVQALEDALAPRLRLAGDTGSLTKFGDFLSGRTMEKGTDIILLYRPEGALELAILPPGTSEYTQVSIPMRLTATGVGAALMRQ